MDARSAKRLKTFADRYAKACADVKEQEERKRKVGELLQQEMERQGIVKVDGTVMTVSLVSGERLTEVSSIKFYEAVPEQLRPKAWEALSVLIEKARKLVGEDVLRSFGKSVPFTRLIVKRRNGQEEEGKEAA